MLKLLLSASPIVIILLMLFVWKQSAWRAGLAGYAAAILLSLLAPAFDTTLAELLHPAVKGALTTSLVAYVLLFGILLFHLMKETSVIDTIASYISQSTRDPIRQVLILAFGLSPLVESSSGFGIAMVVTAPILITLGFDRFKAVLISLVSLSAVPWGSLALGTIIGANLGNIPVHQLGTGSAVLSLPTFLYFAFIAVLIAGGWSGVKRRGWETLAVSGAFALSVLLCNVYLSVELAGVFGSLVAISVELLFIRYAADSGSIPANKATSEVSVTTAAAHNQMGILKTFSPYLLLILLLLLSRVFTPLSLFLQTHFVITLPPYQFALPLLHSPGFFLFLVCLFTAIMFRADSRIWQKSILATWKQGVPVIGSTLFFVGMSEIMATSTMTQTLAQAAAASFGTAFLVISPVIGGLGGFLTGSNTGSNAMFIKLQVQTAQQLGMIPEVFAYGQNTASSHAIMACPSRVLLGASVVNVMDREHELLRKVTLVMLGTIGLVILGVVRMYLF
ncbi:L-lactate permease [Brevibacillus migulae]|uniref:L-lactate permease n=1 Tax=Brevibacillus migulae TaxID=1644114 RepID=UPI00196B65DF|nr:L-lactate permease [Brevibacillus migulae]